MEFCQIKLFALLDNIFKLYQGTACCDINVTPRYYKSMDVTQN